MSRKATDWAWSIDVKPATLKLILLSMADRADEIHQCFPSIDRLVKDTGLNKKTVQKGLLDMIDAGIISDTGKRRGPTGRVRVFQLNLDFKSNEPEIGNVPKNGTLNDPKNGTLNDPNFGVQNQSTEPVNEPKDQLRSPAKKSAANQARDEAFESVWQQYPKREGSNPKNHALSAWKARIAEGHKPEDMLAGLMRYLEHCQTKGNVGTSFVMQAKRFFGPSLEFQNDWAVSQAPAGRGESQQEYWDRVNNDQSWADDLGI